MGNMAFAYLCSAHLRNQLADGEDKAVNATVVGACGKLLKDPWVKEQAGLYEQWRVDVQRANTEGLPVPPPPPGLLMQNPDLPSLVRPRQGHL
jgi:hypothetical protein